MVLRSQLLWLFRNGRPPHGRAKVQPFGSRSAATVAASQDPARAPATRPHLPPAEFSQRAVTVGRRRLVPRRVLFPAAGAGEAAAGDAARSRHRSNRPFGARRVPKSAAVTRPLRLLVSRGLPATVVCLLSVWHRLPGRPDGVPMLMFADRLRQPARPRRVQRRARAVPFHPHAASARPGTKHGASRVGQFSAGEAALPRK